MLDAPSRSYRLPNKQNFSTGCWIMLLVRARVFQTPSKQYSILPLFSGYPLELKGKTLLPKVLHI